MVEVTRRWQKGDLVQKRQKSKWRGRIVGFYDTAETPEGYSVESLFENGSVQVWPLAALDDWDGTGTPEQLQAELAAAKAREAKLVKALGLAEAALSQVGSDLIALWGEEEGDDPSILDALATARAALGEKQ